MSIIAQLKRIEDSSSALSNDKRAVVMDGSLSEVISQALNIQRSRREFYTDQPFYGKENPNVDVPPGGGTVSTIKHDDEPYKTPPRPTLETQAMDEAIAREVAEQFGDSIIDAADEAARNEIHGKPIMAYAIPTDGVVTEEMNVEISDYEECGAVDPSDFIFIYTDHAKLDAGNPGVVDMSAKVSEYEKQGAKVYRDLQSFLSDLPQISRLR